MSRDGIRATLLWVVLSVVGIGVVLAFSMLPPRFSEEAKAVDNAYVLLMILAVPVVMLVVAVLVYVALRFRSHGPDEDGPPLQASKRTVGWWLAITGSLAVFVIINPGFVGLAEIRGTSQADMVIEAQARRFYWTITYANGVQVLSTDRDPATGLQRELVVPEGRRIRFDVSAPDTEVLHSFWIPAFRVKIDAVPGRTTHVYVDPTKEGAFYEGDVTLRIQCAELCGPGHADMMMPVRVLSGGEFDAWLADRAAEGS